MSYILYQPPVMYRARKGMQERAELCPYHSQMPKTKSFSNHQDNIANERSDATILCRTNPTIRCRAYT